MNPFTLFNNDKHCLENVTNHTLETADHQLSVLQMAILLTANIQCTA